MVFEFEYVCINVNPVTYRPQIWFKFCLLVVICLKSHDSLVIWIVSLADLRARLSPSAFPSAKKKKESKPKSWLISWCFGSLIELLIGIGRQRYRTIKKESIIIYKASFGTWNDGMEISILIEWLIHGYTMISKWVEHLEATNHMNAYLSNGFIINKWKKNLPAFLLKKDLALISVHRCWNDGCHCDSPSRGRCARRTASSKISKRWRNGGRQGGRKWQTRRVRDVRDRVMKDCYNNTQLRGISIETSKFISWMKRYTKPPNI